MIKLPAYLVGFNRKGDRSVSCRFETQEISTNDLIELDNHYEKFGWLMFQENDFNEKDIPTEQAEDKSKSPSKRLKNVLFVYSQQKGIQKNDFDRFYRVEIEKIIDHIKTKLD